MEPAGRDKKTRLRLRLLLVTLTFIFSYALLVIPVRNHILLERIQETPAGWDSGVTQADPQMGYRMKPNSTAREFYQDVQGPMTFHDEQGHRVPGPDEPQPPSQGPTLLVIGDSFSYGFGCSAAQTYPQVVARELGMTLENTAQPGWGLCQMLATARERIPEEKPEIVILQHSVWLAQRSMLTFAQSHVPIPTPYFTGDEKPLKIAPPQHETTVFDYPFSSFQKSKGDLGTELRFLLTCGGPFLIREDFRRFGSLLRRLTGSTPPVAKDEGAAFFQTYAEIAELCRQNGSKLVIISIGFDQPVPRSFFEDLGATVVDCQADFEKDIEGKPTRQAHFLVHAVTAGEPPRVLDTHYNARAHALLATGTLRALNEESLKSNASVPGNHLTQQGLIDRKP